MRETERKCTFEYESAAGELHAALLDQRDATQLLASAEKRVDAARKRVHELEAAGRAYAARKR